MERGLTQVGQRFGRLAILEILPEFHKTHRLCICLCDCGNRTKVEVSRVRLGRTKSCGCLRLENTAKMRAARRVPATLEAGLNKIFDTYSRNAFRKSRLFELTKEQFWLIIQQDCYYCGAKPSEQRSYQPKAGGFYSNGLDRVDSALGYTINNCVPCCTKCNIAKHDMGYTEFLDWINSVYEYSTSKKHIPAAA